MTITVTKITKNNIIYDIEGRKNQTAFHRVYTIWIQREYNQVKLNLT